MKKFGRESPAEMMLCINHAIHLAVMDVLYKKEKICETEVESESSESEYSESESRDLIIDVEDVNINEDEADQRFYTRDIAIRPDFKEVLNDTRRIVKLFRRSLLNNGILQEYVKSEFGSELSLCLDVKTRWNSIEIMVDRFLKLKIALKRL